MRNLPQKTWEFEPKASDELSLDGLVVLGRGPYSFKAKRGERVFLMGPSGVGKSLLLQAIADLLPHQGRVNFAGFEASEIAAYLWRQKILYVAAISHWWLPTPREHFIDLDADAPAALGLEPELLDASVATLSTGQSQRLALLRACLLNPSVLMLDEPTANLDKTTKRAVESWLVQWQAKTKAIILWISHDEAQIQRMGGRCLLLQSGGLKEQG